jgi:hypothetical protein
MSWSDLYLMVPGPILALAAGLFIDLSATPARRIATRYQSVPARGGEVCRDQGSAGSAHAATG